MAPRGHAGVIIMTISPTSLTIAALIRKSIELHKICADVRQWTQSRVCWSGEKKL